MSHQRSKQKYQERKTRDEQRRLANRIVLDFSHYCQLEEDGNPGEIVFEVETEKTVKEKLAEAFNGGIPEHAINREYGEVLNRHPVKIHSMTVKYNGGAFQK